MNENFTKIAEMLANKFSVKVSDITPKTDIIEDLAADSLDIVELVTEMEKAFDIIISDSEAEELHTVEDVLNLIEAKKQA